MAAHKQQSRRVITITLDWWTEDSTYIEIPAEHREALDESGFERVTQQMAKGFTSGDLHDNITMLSTDPEDGIEYTGWWSLSWSTPEDE